MGSLHVLFLAKMVACAAGASLDLVDPFIGSGGAGFGAGSHNPGAQIPFGNYRAGPDTGLRDGGKILRLPFQHYGGYAYEDNAVIAFSHTHMVGAGVGDLGNFGVMPVRVPVDTMNSDSALAAVLTTPEGHALPLDHANERARPGQYSIAFTHDNISASLLAVGSHNGTHRFYFGGGLGAVSGSAPPSSCGVLIDVCHTAMGDNKRCKKASIRTIVNASNGKVHIQASLRMAGSLTERGPKGGVDVYFHATIDSIGSTTVRRPSPASVRLWASGQMLPPGTLHGTAAQSLGAFVSWPCNSGDEQQQQLTLQMDNSISFIGSDQARKNHDRLMSSSLTLAQLRAHTEAMWADRLSVVHIDESDATTNETHALLKKFYTAVYHANLAPSIYDEDGVYLSFNTGDSVMQVNGADHAYTDMSIWDIHRTQLPWLSLTAPGVLEDVLLSLQRMTEQGGGDIPRWPIANIYAECMIGSHGFVSIADAVQKGQASKLNLTKLFASMKRTATLPRARAGRACIVNYTRMGYVPNECSAQSASLTLAYAFDDAAVATVAAAVGAADDAVMFRNRSRSGYKLLWDAKRMLLCPRNGNGSGTGGAGLVCPFDPALPYPFEKRYTEGDALQWLWFVPHDVAGLVGLFPTPKAFVAKLNQFFLDARTIKQGGKWAGGTLLANAWYWAGNEPDILAPWMFSLAGREYHNFTSFWTRWLVDNDYSVGADGLPGNDDYGTLSAWLLWSVLGFYPLSGSDEFVLGAPRFEKVRLRRRHLNPDVADLCVLAHNASLPGHTVVGKIVLNGAEVTGSVIKYRDLSRGLPDASGGDDVAVLEFFMVKG